MENNIEEKPKKSLNLKKTFVIVLHVLSAFVFLFLSYKLYICYKYSKTSSNKMDLSYKKEAISETTTLSDDGWVVTDFMGAYTFEYPKGWHVGNFWPDDYTAPITVAINPKPLNTSPRGGPLAAVVFKDKSGMDDPLKYLNERKNHFKTEYFNSVKENSVAVPFGMVYHYEGEIDFYDETSKNEAYLFMIDGPIDNSINKHVIEFIGNPFSDEHADILKHIVMSFKEDSPYSTSEKKTEAPEQDLSDLIKVSSPLPNSVVKSPLTITGEARGTWFFEGDFPITFYYGVSEEITSTVAVAQGEWMTEDFVPFTATISFPKSSGNEGLLVLSKNNPSDIEGTQQDLKIPVRFE